MIHWDDRKRRENLRRHSIDLAELESIFDFPMLTIEDDRSNYGEQRLQSLGLFNTRVVFLVWTPRADDEAHLISCRYANRKEEKTYFSLIL